jgi:hypothetical protein
LRIGPIDDHQAGQHRIISGHALAEVAGRASAAVAASIDQQPAAAANFAVAVLG